MPPTLSLRAERASCISAHIRMHNPFAIAVQWPDDPRRYLIHLQRPYFAAAIHETASAAWLAISWSPGVRPEMGERDALFMAAAEFCRSELGQLHVPIEFVERTNGYPLPPLLMAQSTDQQVYIVEPEHATPLVEVREGQQASASKRKAPQRYDVITEWRLTQMRRYYQQFLERQNRAEATPLGAPGLTSAKK
jgi:hypothetical protein